MRNVMVAAMLGGVLAAVTVSTAGARQAVPPDEDGRQQLLEWGGQLAPKAPVAATARTAAAPPAGPNPYLALVPDPAAVDYSGWARYLDRRGASGRRSRASPAVADPGRRGRAGGHDRRATTRSPRPQTVDGFGTRRNENARLRILGTLSPTPDVIAEPVAGNPRGRRVDPARRRHGHRLDAIGITTSAVIGDGPHGSGGSGSGDFDFYAVDLAAGDQLMVDIDTPTRRASTRSSSLFDAAGNFVALNDDNIAAGELDSLAAVPVVHRAAATTCWSAPSTRSSPDPFDSGERHRRRQRRPVRRDDHRRAGRRRRLRRAPPRRRRARRVGGRRGDPDRRLRPCRHARHGLRPGRLLRLPAAVTAAGRRQRRRRHVADETGWHYVGVSGGSGPLRRHASRSTGRGSSTDRPTQTLFLDFDGARVNTAHLRRPGRPPAEPAASFLGRWGLRQRRPRPAHRPDRRHGRARTCPRTWSRRGLNRHFRLHILNSRDDPDPFGQPNVSRVIVGGTIDESGIPTIGIAQSIDPGNFGTEETALVLLDVLSEPERRVGDPSLNTYIDPGTATGSRSSAARSATSSPTRPATSSATGTSTSSTTRPT